MSELPCPEHVSIGCQPRCHFHPLNPSECFPIGAVKLQTGWRMIALSMGTKYIWCHMLRTRSASFLSISCDTCDMLHLYTYTFIIDSQQDEKSFYTYTPSGRINLMIDQPEKVNAHINLSHWAIVCYIVFLCFLMCNDSMGLQNCVGYITHIEIIHIAVSGCRPNSTQFIHGMDAYRSIPYKILGSSVRASFSFSGSLDSRGPPLKTLSGKRLKPFKFQSNT